MLSAHTGALNADLVLHLTEADMTSVKAPPPVEPIVEIADELDFGEQLKYEPSEDIQFLLTMIKEIHERCVTMEHNLRITKQIDVEGHFDLISCLSDAQSHVVNILTHSKWSEDLGFETDINASTDRNMDHVDFGNAAGAAGPSSAPAPARSRLPAVVHPAPVKLSASVKPPTVMRPAARAPISVNAVARAPMSVNAVAPAPPAPIAPGGRGPDPAPAPAVPPSTAAPTATSAFASVPAPSVSPSQSPSSLGKRALSGAAATKRSGN